MTIDMPPQIPPVIIEYVNEHDYLPDEAKDASLSEFINECHETYNGHKIYRLGIIDKLDSESVGYKYKNCYLLLSNKKETRCSTPEEEKDIIYHYQNLAKKFTSDIPIDVIKLARIHTKFTRKIKHLNWYDSIEYEWQRYYSPAVPDGIYNGYYVYGLGFPSHKTYGKNCDIILHNDNETRCATKEEHLRVIVPFAIYDKYY